MKKQFTAGLLSFTITLFVLGGITAGYLAITKNDEPAVAVNSSNKTTPPDKKEFCDIISAEEMKKITNVTFKKPMSTKSVVTTGLSSQTCAYIATKPSDSVQLVLKYQTSGKSIPTIEENWQTLKNQNMNTLLKSSVSKDAFTTQNTLYVYENKQIITVSSSLGNAIQEQIVKELL